MIRRYVLGKRSSNTPSFLLLMCSKPNKLTETDEEQYHIKWATEQGGSHGVEVREIGVRQVILLYGAHDGHVEIGRHRTRSSAEQQQQGEQEQQEGHCWSEALGGGHGAGR